MDYKYLRESYKNFKESVSGIHYFAKINDMIESHHKLAEENPESAAYEMKQAAGLREALNYIRSMSVDKSSTERGEQ